MQADDTIIDYEPHFETVYVRASAGKRFANYLIDMVAFYLVAIAIGIFIAFYRQQVLKACWMKVRVLN